MKTFLHYTLMLVLSFCLNNQHSVHAQATIEVYALETSFSPADITINLGDTLRWINNSSTLHDINGTTITYPSNPESFEAPNGLTSSYAYKFNTPGTYHYRCNIHYSMGMTGIITVGPNAELTEMEKLAKLIIIYPNPAQYSFTIINNTEIYFTDFEMFATSGKSIMKKEFSNNIDLPELDNGIYYLKLSGQNTTITKMVIIE